MNKDTLLVSCPGVGGGLFVLNGSACARISARPITGVFVGNRQLLIGYQQDGGSSVRALINGLMEERMLSADPMDLHDLFVSDDHIYAAVTEDNKVVCFDINLQFVSAWGLEGEKDAAHLNSVAVYQGRLLASVFGRFQHHREYKNGTLGRGEVVDIQTGETFISGLSQPHSLTTVGDLLYLCSSEDKEVRVYHGNDLLRQIPVPGYARGLAIGTKYIYVGISLSRNAPAGEKGSAGASIAVLEKETMSLVDLLQLQANEIYDIRNINEASWVLPYLLSDPDDKQVRFLIDSLSLYQRGYESYKSAYDDLARITVSWSWKMVRPLIHLERIIRKLAGRIVKAPSTRDF